MMSRLEGEERRRGTGYPFSDKAPYPPPFLGPAPHTDMGYFKVQVCALSRKLSIEIFRSFVQLKKLNRFFVSVCCKINQIDTLQVRGDCQLVRQTMHGRAPAGCKPKEPQCQPRSQNLILTRAWKEGNLESGCCVVFRYYRVKWEKQIECKAAQLNSCWESKWVWGQKICQGKSCIWTIKLERSKTPKFLLSLSAPPSQIAKSCW